MLKRAKPRLAMKYISECDIIFYDVHEGNPKDVELGLQALEKYTFEEEKILILISSVAVWKNTPAKLEEIVPEKNESEKSENNSEEGEGEKEGEADPDVDSEDENKDKEKKDSEGEDGEGEEGEKEDKKPPTPKTPEPEVPKEYRNLPYSESEFAGRIPPKEYQKIKEVEDTVLAFKKPNLKVYVIAAGIMYGNGEQVFNTHFKSAWLQKPQKLNYFGEGLNKIPTIHVKDLVTLVHKLIEVKPEQQYVFGIDNTEDRT